LIDRFGGVARPVVRSPAPPTRKKEAMTQFKANSRVKKNISSDLSPTMLDAMLYGACQGYQGSVSANRRTEDALIKRGLITYDHNVMGTDGDHWLYPVITAKGWTFLWETNKVTRPADDDRLPIGSALEEAHPSDPVVTPFPKAWTDALDAAAHRPYGRFPAMVAGSVIASLGERGLATLAPVREDADWETKRGYDFCLTPAGWDAVNLERPADPDRLTLAEALAFVPTADMDGRVKMGFRFTSLGDAARLSLMTVDHPDQPIREGDRVEITWKMSGSKSVGTVDRITDDSVSWAIEEGTRVGQAYSSVYRRVVTIRVLATVEERKHPARLTLERALEEAYAPSEPTGDLDVVWVEGITLKDLLEDVQADQEPTPKPGRKPTVISISARLYRMGFGRYSTILRNTAATTGFMVRKGTMRDTVSVTWRPGSEFDSYSPENYRREVERNREYMAGLYVQALKDAGYKVTSNGYTVTVSPS
jgi:hypothetical protein